MAEAGGQLLTAAFGFLSHMLPEPASAPALDTVAELRQQLLDSAETDAAGCRSLKINLPSDEALTQFAEVLAKLLAVNQPGKNS